MPAPAVAANRVRVYCATPGTGTLSLGAAVERFLTPDQAGVANGQTVRFAIIPGDVPGDFELATGVYTTSGATLTRATVLSSIVAGTPGTSKINLSGDAGTEVWFLQTAEDFADLWAAIDGKIAASLLTTRGDMIRRGASAPERFALGTQHQVLRAGATDPEWGAVDLSQAAAVANVLPAANLPDGSLTAEGVFEMATPGEFLAKTDTTRVLGVDATWDAVAYVAGGTGSGSYAPDFATGLNFSRTMNGNSTFGNPTNAVQGQCGVTKWTASGANRTLAKGTNLKDMTGNVWPITVNSGNDCYVSYYVDGASNVIITGVGNNPA